MRREYSDAELRWAAWKHRMGYGWDAIAKALALPTAGLYKKVQRSGYAYELPKPRPMPADCPDWVDWAWELYLEGYSLIRVALTCGRYEDAISRAFRERGYRKVMPPLITTWIFGWKGSRK